MRIDLDVVTGRFALRQCEPFSVLFQARAPTRLKPVAFFDDDGVLPAGAMAEAKADIVAPESEVELRLARDVILAGTRFVVVGNKWLAWNRMEGEGTRTPDPSDPPYLRIGPEGNPFLDFSEGEIEDYPGKFIFMFYDPASMYHHWMLECVPRIIVALQDSRLSEFKFVFPDNRPKFVDETLDILGVAANRRTFYDPKRLARFELMALSPVPIYERNNVSITALKALRDTLIPAIRQNPVTHRRKIVFTRRDARNSERLLLNETDVISALEAEGFVAVESGTMTVREQIALTHGAEIIVCIHGSAGANLAFCQPRAKVLHVFPDCAYFFVSHGICVAAARADQAYLYGASFQRGLRLHNNPWIVSPDRVVGAVRRLERAKPWSTAGKRWDRLLATIRGT